MKKLSLGEAIARCPHALRCYVSMTAEQRRAFIRGARTLHSQEEMLDYVQKNMGSVAE